MQLYAIDADGSLENLPFQDEPKTQESAGYQDPLKQGKKQLEVHQTGRYWFERNSSTKELERDISLPEGISYMTKFLWARRTAFFPTSFGPLVFLTKGAGNNPNDPEAPALLKWPTK